MGRKFTIFALFNFVFESKFQVQAPGGAYIGRGDLTEGFLRYEFWGGLYLEGRIHGGAYFRNFTVYGYIFSHVNEENSKQRSHDESTCRRTAINVNGLALRETHVTLQVTLYSYM